MECMGCRYYRRVIDKNDVSKNSGNCWRYPPTPQPLFQGANMMLVSMRPPVGSRDACGEWAELDISDI